MLDTLCPGPYGLGRYGLGTYGLGPYGLGTYGLGPYSLGTYVSGPRGLGSKALNHMVWDSMALDPTAWEPLVWDLTKQKRLSSQANFRKAITPWRQKILNSEVACGTCCVDFFECFFIIYPMAVNGGQCGQMEADGAFCMHGDL